MGTTPGRDGIGGFMEAVLALMVVICGVMLVTVSLGFVGIDLRRDSGAADLQDGCRSMQSDQLFSLGSPFFDGDVLKNSSLGMMNTSLFHVSAQVKGYCITLQDITLGTPSSGHAEDRGRLFGQRYPVDLHAGLLSMTGPDRARRQGHGDRVAMMHEDR